jgi:hypothetical protein
VCVRCAAAGFWASTGWGSCATTMQRHVWGGGSPGATGAAASPESESVQANDGWKLSTDVIHVSATGFAIIGALLHASLPPPTAEKVMSNHFASPDASGARSHVSAFGRNKVTATDSAHPSVCDFESGTGVGGGGGVAKATASGDSTGALDQMHDGSVSQARNFGAQDESRLHSLGAYHDNVYGQERANKQISPHYGGLSSASDRRDDEPENSTAYASQMSAQALGSSGAIASPTRGHSASGAVRLSVSAGTH